MWILILVPLALAAFVYYYLWNRSQYFKKRGIPGPEPSSLLYGNLEEYQAKKQQNLKLVEWEKEYGKVFGFFDGGMKTYVTSDLDILQDVFVRKFENFHGRRPLSSGGATDPDKDSNVHVFAAQGLRWKRLRMITNPSFSANKLKAMEPAIQDSIRGFMGEMAKNEAQPFDIYPYFQQLTLDVIQQVAFGKPGTHFGKGPIPYLEPVKNAFNPGQVVKQPLMKYFAIFPELKPITRHLTKLALAIQGMPILAIMSKITEVVALRKTKGAANPPKDFIDIFLNAEADDADLKKIETEKEQNIERKHIKIDKKLTEPEIVSQCFVFLLAGYDTTANSLAYLSYHLAMNPAVQQKLIAEIDDYIQSDDDINYEMVGNLTYLDWCLKESLRMEPLASNANSRHCSKTCMVGDKLEIEEGCYIQSNVWAIHYDKNIWGPDADIYKPERFDPDTLIEPRHPLAWQPFGAGPRTCIGMRFALLEAKSCMCYILRKYTIEKCDQTKLDRTGTLTLGPKDVTIKLVKR